MNVSWLKFGLFIQLNMLIGYMCKSCSNHVCFTWKVSNANLTLVCRVSQLNHRVKILDPHDTIQADCLPPFPETICDKLNENISVYQNASTNETIMILSGQIDSHVNGVWTCLHGKQRGLAKVEVTVLIVKEIHTVSTPLEENTVSGNMTSSSVENNKGRDCTAKTLLRTMGGFILAVAITLIALSFVRHNKDIQKHERCTCMCSCIKGNPRAVTGVKRFIFALIASLMIILAYVGALIDQDKCIGQWAFPIISILVGILNTILFLHEDKNTGKFTENDDKELHTFNAELQGDNAPCLRRQGNAASQL